MAVKNISYKEAMNFVDNNGKSTLENAWNNNTSITSSVPFLTLGEFFPQSLSTNPTIKQNLSFLHPKKNKLKQTKT